MAQTSSPSPKRDINAVLAAHDKELLAMPDVVGVYVGTLEDRSTPCLRVMLARKNPETERKIPRSIEGYPCPHRGERGDPADESEALVRSWQKNQNAPSLFRHAGGTGGALETNETKS